jgi:hypothetical protein
MPGTPEQAASLGQALTKAKQMAQRAYDDVMNIELDDFTDPDVWERFTLWFGDPRNKENRDKVSATYYAILLEFNKPTYPANLNPNGKSLNNYADTNGWLPGAYTTSLNPSFWLQNPVTPPSSQAGILIHETAHAVDRKIGDPGPTTIKKHIDKPGNPVDMLIWKQWASTPRNVTIAGGPGQAVWVFGGIGGGVNDLWDKINDGNCYKYFSEHQK